MRIYATSDDLSTWTGQPAPENAVPLIRHASLLVERSTRTAIYATNPAGFPADEDIAEAFRDAVTAQASYWAAHSIDPAKGVLGEASAKVAVSKSIGGASVSYDAASLVTAQQARAEALANLSEEAWLILDQAGLLNGQPAS